MNIRNNGNFVGRLANDVTFEKPQTTASGKSYQRIKFGLFVDRDQKDKSDYIPMTATIWSGTDGQLKPGPWSFIHKGDLIALNGHLETWFTENKSFGMAVVVDHVDIGLESKSVREARHNPAGFTGQEFPEDIADNLPL